MGVGVGSTQGKAQKVFKFTHNTENASFLSVVVVVFLIWGYLIHLFGCFCALGTGSIPCAVQAGLEITFFLPQLPKCLDAGVTTTLGCS